MAEATKEFSRFAVKTKFNDLPKAVVTQTKRCLLDTIGCTVAGFSSRAMHIVVAFVKQLGGNRESTIWSVGGKVPSFWAAFANSCSAHDLELDDGHVLGHTHPGATTIPPAIAIAETIKANGKDLITAISLGYELNVRLGEAITPSALYARHFHVPGLVGSFSAALAVGKMLDLDEVKMANAIGIACLGPVALMETFQAGAMTKDAYAGWPAGVGTMAALLAQKGFTGADTILEGESGFCQAVADEYHVEKLTEELGSEWRIMTVYQKRHAMCSHGHTAMDAALRILDKTSLNPNSMRSILVKTYGFASTLNNPEPKTDVAARFSIPYCLAVVLTKGRPVGPDDFTDSMLHDEKILRLSKRVRLVLDSEVDNLHKERDELRRSIVEVLIEDGKSHSACVDIAKGWPDDPLMLSELEAKFRTLTSTTLDKKRGTAIVETLGRLEDLKVADLVSLLN